jgi:hypothetical protein
MDENAVPDPLDQLLAVPAVPAGKDLRQALLLRTTGVLRRRRWGRRCVLAAALAACYAAGVLTVPPQPPDGPPEVVHDRPVTDTPATSPRPDDSPLALEWQGLDNPVGRAEALRGAAAGYERAGDLASAVRCYRNAIDSGSEEDAQITADDDWLLMVLKDAKQKEKRHAHNDG